MMTNADVKHVFSAYFWVNPRWVYVLSPLGTAPTKADATPPSIMKVQYGTRRPNLQKARNGTSPSRDQSVKHWQGRGEGGRGEGGGGGAEEGS